MTGCWEGNASDAHKPRQAHSLYYILIAHLWLVDKRVQGEAILIPPWLLSFCQAAFPDGSDSQKSCVHQISLVLDICVKGVFTEILYPCETVAGNFLHLFVMYHAILPPNLDGFIFIFCLCLCRTIILWHVRGKKMTSDSVSSQILYVRRCSI